MKYVFMRIKAFIANLLIMSKAERNGSFVLLIILVLLILVRIAIPHLKKDDSSYFEEIERKIAILEKQKDSLNLIEASKKSMQDVTSIDRNNNISNKVEHTKLKPQYFQFDPNTVSYSELLSLGLSDKVAATFLKFRLKGAKFYKPDDLKKVYGIDSITYQKLKDYITIATYKNNLQEKDTLPKKVFSIEINSADSADWVKLFGIGPVYARRICNYRKYLGGFVYIEQLKEVYNLPEETYNNIYHNLRIDTLNVKQININFADIDNLKRHPYCTYASARKIVNYRAENGSFLSINQLLLDSVLSVYEFKRLSPYYTLSN